MIIYIFRNRALCLFVIVYYRRTQHLFTRLFIYLLFIYLLSLIHKNWCQYFGLSSIFLITSRLTNWLFRHVIHFGYRNIDLNDPLGVLFYIFDNYLLWQNSTFLSSICNFKNKLLRIFSKLKQILKFVKQNDTCM